MRLHLRDAMRARAVQMPDVKIDCLGDERYDFEKDFPKFGVDGSLVGEWSQRRGLLEGDDSGGSGEEEEEEADEDEDDSGSPLGPQLHRPDEPEPEHRASQPAAHACGCAACAGLLARRQAGAKLMLREKRLLREHAAAPVPETLETIETAGAAELGGGGAAGDGGGRFVAAATFGGARPGWLYKTGPDGLGCGIARPLLLPKTIAPLPHATRWQCAADRCCTCLPSLALCSSLIGHLCTSFLVCS